MGLIHSNKPLQSRARGGRSWVGGAGSSHIQQSAGEAVGRGEAGRCTAEQLPHASKRHRELSHGDSTHKRVPNFVCTPRGNSERETGPSAAWPRYAHRMRTHSNLPGSRTEPMSPISCVSGGFVAASACSMGVFVSGGNASVTSIPNLRTTTKDSSVSKRRQAPRDATTHTNLRHHLHL